MNIEVSARFGKYLKKSILYKDLHFLKKKIKKVIVQNFETNSNQSNHLALHQVFHCIEKSQFQVSPLERS